MNILFRFMGWVAKTNHVLSRQSINFIPLNLALIAVTGFIGVACWGILFSDHNAVGLVAIPFSLFCLAFVVALLKGNTFFTAEPLPALTAVSDDAPLQTNLTWTGRLRLTEKAAQKFLDMPTTATRLENGSFALASRIDASSRFSGFVVSSKVGVWLAIPQPSTFEIEAGSFYYGFKGAPALRLRFIDGTDSKKTSAIMAFETPETRNAFYAWLEAEKARAGGQSIRTTAPVSNNNSPFTSSTNN